MTGEAIRTVGLRRDFGERHALAGIDFAVEPGALFGLLGPNGGGKSTLFRILSTLLPPTSGSAEVFGHDVVREPARVREAIGVVFQSASLDGKLRVRENLQHQGNLYGLSGQELDARIDDLLERFNLAARAQDIVAELSGGLQRRVEIAKGLIHRPRLLLLDEPSTGLDPAARRELWLQLLDIRDKDGTTVLLTTHILEEADGCDCIAILDSGHLIAQGSPRALKSEISGDVVTLETGDAQAAVAALKTLGIEAETHGGALRFSAMDGHAIAQTVARELGDRVESVTVGRPSLEDVFLTRTGHAFEAAE